MPLNVAPFDSPSDLQAFVAKKVLSAVVVGGGTNYKTDDLLTVVDGAGETAAILRVTGHTGGVINTVSVESGGAYVVSPTNPVVVTGGAGLGATFNLTLGGNILQTDIFTVEVCGRRWYLFYWT